MILFIWWHLQRYQVNTFYRNSLLELLRYLELQTRLPCSPIVYCVLQIAKYHFICLASFKIAEKASNESYHRLLPKKQHRPLSMNVPHQRLTRIFFKETQSSLILTLKMEIKRESICGSSGTALEIDFDGREFKSQIAKGVHLVVFTSSMLLKHFYAVLLST